MVPFYRRLHDAIRAHDNEKLLLYDSGMEIGDRLTTPVGFGSGPVGPKYDTEQALVLHNYNVLCDRASSGPYAT
jgi:hypothetical protein